MHSISLLDYLESLKSLPPEVPIEPELKQQRLAQDAKIREEQDLRGGAVLQAVLEGGEGEETPQSGDLVYVHVTARDEEDLVLYSTSSQEGGNGQPLAFMVEKGQRAPRGWEVVLLGMRLKQITMVKLKPQYGFGHPDCGMQAPKGIPMGQTLSYELQLVRWYPGASAGDGGRGVGVLATLDGSYRKVVEEGKGWESPRAPFEVVFRCKACCPAYDGSQMTGYVYFSTEEKPLEAQLGSGELPPGIEAALGSMSQGERSVFVIPALQMTASSKESRVPPPPTACHQVELELELIELVQVRDMTGDGAVMKRRVKKGEGEFPIDCPLEDTTVQVHYKVRKQDASSSSKRKDKSSPWSYDSREGSSGTPLELDTGCGELPEALELAIKLMVTGEVARISSNPSHAYGCPASTLTPPPGIMPSDAVEFEVELIGFDRDGHWQQLTMEKRFAMAEKIRRKANDLFRARKFAFARKRYERLVRLAQTTRDYETHEEMDQMNALLVTLLSNLALCCFQQGDYLDSVSFADKALQLDPTSAKLLLRRARAQSMKGDYGKATDDLQAALHVLGEGSMVGGAEIKVEVEQEILANKKRAVDADKRSKATFKFKI